MPEPIDVMRAIFGFEVDSSKLETGLQDAEQKAQTSTEKIAGSFNTMAVGIATALAMTVAAAMRSVIHETEELTVSMKELGERMGMSTTDASVFVGVLERVGIGHQEASMSIAMLAEQIKNTSRALDPFRTRLGQTLGPMRDMQGSVLTISQVLDLARQKVSSTTDSLQQLQIAQELFGVRRGGRMLEVLKMTNEEFGRFKQSVSESGIVIDEESAKLGKEYEEAISGMNQSLRGLELQLGEKVLPMLVDFTNKMATIVQAVSSFAATHPELTKMVAVFGLLVAPAMALGLALVFAGKSIGTLTAFASRMGIQFSTLNEVMHNVNFALERMTMQEVEATAATTAHTAAVTAQTTALAANAAAATAKGAAGAVAGAAGSVGGGAAMAAAGGGIGAALGAAALPIMLLSLVPAAYQVGQIFSTQIQWAFIKVREFLPEFLGGVKSGTAAIFLELERSADEAKKKADEASKVADATRQKVEATEREQQEYMQAEERHVSLIAQAEKLGLATMAERRAALAEEREVLERRIEVLQQELSAPGETLNDAQKLQKENEILQLRTRVTQESAKIVTDTYAQEELQLKARGALGIESEMRLTQEKLNDERIVGDERLRLEGQLFQKRRQYEEEVVDLAKKLGFANVDDEIQFRRQRAAQEIGAGNVVQGVQEFAKARDLQMKQFDEQVSFIKKIRFISLQDEIEFQKQKLAYVKGNAEEERKVLVSIADLDKQLYDQRLNYALNYAKNIQANNDEMKKLASSKGPQESFEQAAREAEVQQKDVYHQAEVYGRFGGTGEQREWAVKMSQAALSQYQQLKQMGDEIPQNMQDFIEVAKGILKRASGGIDVRAYGEAQPVVGSLTSPAEGLATSNLARGTEIPRLDTSFVDIAVRMRDVLLGTVPNVQAFSNAIASATRQLTGQAGTGILTPPGPGPQGQPALATGIGTPAQPNYGVSPQVSVGGGASGPSGLDKAISDLRDVVAGVKDVVSKSVTVIADFGQKQTDQWKAISDQLKEGSTVQMSFDENTGQMTANYVVKTTLAELKR